MGLDMYAYVTKADIPAVDFDEPQDAFDLHYWRKHPNLHGWMEAVYFEKGGTDPDFNCVCVRLDASDLDALERTIGAEQLPHTQGFFFGRSDGSERDDDLHFVRKARDALARGLRVYYTSWW